METAINPRVRALVLLAPAVFWFAPPASLAHIRIPILMFSGEHDDITPAGQAEIVRDGVAEGMLEHRVIQGAGHFSFQSVFPLALTRPDFAPSQDPPGFDRAAFQPVLHAEIAAFLRRCLAITTLDLQE